MILTAALALAVSQCPPYVRTKVKDDDPKSHCLYWREKTQIDWVVNQQGNPETTGDTEFTAIERAFGTWQSQLASCASLSLKQGARTPLRETAYAPNGSNNQNVILWRYTRCTDSVGQSDACWKDESCGNQYDCWQHNPGALAITTTSYDPITGRILDADIELNTPSFIFTTVDAPPCVKPLYSQSCVATDVQNTMTHEIGHMLGLAHSCQSGSTMYASASPGELNKRALDDGSKQFVCETYPKDRPSQDCIIKTFNGALGRPDGCAAAPGGLFVAAALMLWRRRS